MMTPICKMSVTALLVLGSSLCFAGAFNLTPVRIFMSPRDRAVAVTVNNDADEELVIQAEVFSWRQNSDGTDDFKPTDDLVLSPPITKVPPKSRQVFRLLRTSAPPVDDEATYRLIVREIPEASTRGSTIGMPIALAFSLPVFITPPTAKRQLNCAFQRASRDRITAACENVGGAYIFFRSFTLAVPDGPKLAEADLGGFNYLLPHVKRSFSLKTAAPISAGHLKVSALFDDATEQSFEFDLAE